MLVVVVGRRNRREVEVIKILKFPVVIFHKCYNFLVTQRARPAASGARILNRNNNNKRTSYLAIIESAFAAPFQAIRHWPLAPAAAAAAVAAAEQLFTWTGTTRLCVCAFHEFSLVFRSKKRDLYRSVRAEQCLVSGSNSLVSLN